MAGIYVHIPLCKNRCAYCSFHSETALASRDALVDCIVKELKIRKNYLNGETVETVYFGGGTPSLLAERHFVQIFDALFSTFSISRDAEITIEANPDDLYGEYVAMLLRFPFNRASIGIQTFNDEKLKFLNRRHTAQQAFNAVSLCKKLGFKNISIDLIYGLPNQTTAEWEGEIEKALNLDIQHISVYCLSYEKGARLYNDLQNNKITPADDEILNEMYHKLCLKMSQNGFEHYEISNFARCGFRSRHNSSYWRSDVYLGVGAAAHSFDGNSRQWNIASNAKYIAAVNSEKKFYEKEALSFDDKFNEFVMLSLRTSEGIDLKELTEKFGNENLQYLLKNTKKFIEQKFVSKSENHLKFTEKGINISNLVMSDLMIIK